MEVVGVDRSLISHIERWRRLRSQGWTVRAYVRETKRGALRRPDFVVCLRY